MQAKCWWLSQHRQEHEMRIMISSAGRRVYLVQRLREALYEAGLAADVIVVEHPANAAAAAGADGCGQAPASSRDEYTPAVLDTVGALQPELFISLNDHEVIALSEGLADGLRARGVVPRVRDQASHRAVADKLL